jgi:thiamine-phosphate pyrophosphorylase
MHIKLPNFFTFIDVLNEHYIRKLDKKIAIIYRNYSTTNDEQLILNIKKICSENGRKFFLSNNLRMAKNLNLDGVYLPAFNTKENTKNTILKKKFIIIGSAHSIKEIKIKERQGAELIFISPLFKNIKNVKYLNPVKFNLLASKTNKKVIALGGISMKNLKKLKLTKAYGFAAISYFKNNDKIKL